MAQVRSGDGTPIAYDIRGAGPVLVIVDGATQYRAVKTADPLLADLLAERFTVVSYDRRGRGESGDTGPYAVAREVEDIAALIAAMGGRASLVGFSSGAVLAIEAASAFPAMVDRLAAYEPPIDPAQSRETSWANVAAFETLAEAGDGDGAMARFMAELGMPAGAIEQFRSSPIWPAFAAVGHTIAYDMRILAEATDAGLPARWRRAAVPALILDGAASHGFMRAGADAVAAALPDAGRRTLAGQDHNVAMDVLAPVLIEFLTRPAAAGGR